MTWEPEPTDWPRPRREPSETDAHVRDLLPAYVNDTLAPGEYGRVVAHLRRCAGCRAGLTSWEAIAQTVRTAVATNAPASDRLLQRVMLALDEPAGWDDFAATPSLFVKPDPVPPAPSASDWSPVMPPPATPIPATTARPHPHATARRRPIMAELSAATVLVLIVAGLVASFRLAPDDDERGQVPGAGDDQTPPALAPVSLLGPEEALDIADCTTRPRPPGTVLDLIETQTETAPIFPPFSADDRAALVDLDDLLADRPAADPATTARLADTLRQLTACRFYAGEYDERGENGLNDYDGRYWSLFSADFFRRELGTDRVPGTEPRLSAFWFPTDPRPFVVDTTWTLPDGRVAATVDHPSDDSPDQALFVFALDGDRWLIDELGPLEPRPALVPEGPTDPADFSAAHHVVLIDDRAFSQAPSTASAFRVGQEVYLTVANLGTRPQRFEIPAFGVSLDVAAGHSVSFRVAAPSGRYELASYVTTAPDTERRLLAAEIVFVDEGTPIHRG